LNWSTNRLKDLEQTKSNEITDESSVEALGTIDADDPQGSRAATAAKLKARVTDHRRPDRQRPLAVGSVRASSPTT
jgi:hypothetical protein